MAANTAMTEAAIAQRLEPVGKLNISGKPAAETTTSSLQQRQLSGKQIYENICSDCHATGEARSPRFGSKSAWAPRYAKGFNVLYEHAINGFNFMPPKGTCDECSEDEIKAAVRYMVEHSRQ